MSWKERNLAELIDLHDHIRIPLSGVEREKRQGEFPYYGAQSVIDHIDAYLFDGDYVLVAEDGENLRSRKQPIAQIVRGKFWVNNHAHILTAKQGVSNNSFIRALINWIDISPYVTGAAQPKLSQGSLRSIKVRVPDSKTQLQISTVIDAYDDLIEINCRRIALLEESARLLYREWFVNLRFPEHETTKIASGIPHGWKRKTVGELTAFLNRGITPKYDDTATGLVINQKCIRGGLIGLAPARRQSKEVKADRLLQVGDVLINSTGAGTLGRVAQIRSPIPACTVDTHVTIARPTDVSRAAFLGVTLLELEPLLSTMGVGSTNQLELSRSAIAALPVLEPPASLQQAFNELAWPILTQADTLVQTNDKLAKARDELLPKLMSGAITV